MNVNVFDDPLRAAGTGVGVYLAVAGLAILAGMPWKYASSSVGAVAQIIGSLVTVGIGIGLAWLVRR